MLWVSRITSVGLSIVIPAGIGFAVDYSLNTRPWGLLVGAVIGLMAGGSQFQGLLRDVSNRPKG